jgi:uncharacterized protein (DUF362 family)
VSKPKVAVLRTNPDSVLDDIARLMELAGAEGHLQSGVPTIIKDNISWHFPFPSANTTPWQLEGTILALQKMGLRDLLCVANNTVVTNTFKGERLNRYLPIFRRHEIPILYNFRSEDVTWVRYRPNGPLRALHKLFPDGIPIPDCFQGKNIVHLPTMKCHIYTDTTGSMKNAFGGLLGTKRHYTHSSIHETLVDLLRIQKEIHTGIFTVTDGTTCGDGPGPRTMRPVVKNYMLAGGDPVAVDSVASKMLGFDPMELGYIRMAHEDGLGVGKPSEIELVGEDVSDVSFGFSVGDNMASRVGDLFWFSPLKVFQHLLFRTPLVYLFVFASAFYHDRLWYPLKGKPRFDEWCKTPWGQLFLTYPE